MTKEPIKIKFPIHIHTSNQTIREHWTKRRNRNQKISIILKSELSKHKLSLPISVTFNRLSPRKLDYDNLVFAFKFVRDYIATVLVEGTALGVADSDPRISWHYEQQSCKTKGFEITFHFPDSKN